MTSNLAEAGVCRLKVYPFLHERRVALEASDSQYDYFNTTIPAPGSTLVEADDAQH